MQLVSVHSLEILECITLPGIPNSMCILFINNTCILLIGTRDGNLVHVRLTCKRQKMVSITEHIYDMGNVPLQLEKYSDNGCLVVSNTVWKLNLSDAGIHLIPILSDGVPLF